MASQDNTDRDPDHSIESLLAFLEKQSRFLLHRTSPTTWEFTGENGAKFLCKRIANPDDPVLDGIRRLFSKSFRKEEHDPFRELEDTVRDPKFDVFALMSLQEELIGASLAGHFEIPRTNESIMFVDNIATDPQWHNKGFARGLYTILCEQAKTRAQAKGKKIRAILGEAGDEIEDFWNKLGWKRIYAYMESAFSETSYFRPPLQWDFSNGNPLKGYDAAPRHLMAWIANGQYRPLNIMEFIVIVERIYIENFLPAEKQFHSTHAYRRCKGELYKLLGKTQGNLRMSRIYSLSLFTREERERMASTGILKPAF
jgi:GNAT superfamily N-acetyltransferase